VILSPSRLWTNRARAGTPHGRLIVVIGSVISVLGLAAVLFLFDPCLYGFYPRCPLYTITGLHCPGCGALRGLHELLHGHLLTALRMNSLLFLGLPLVGFVCFHPRVRNKESASANVLKSPLPGWWALAAIVLFWILRNIPVYPFTLLAP